MRTRPASACCTCPGALTREPPAEDPLEPNDDIRYVDGRAFGKPSPPLYRRAGPASIAAAADFAEDPVDVYRVKLRPRAGACGSRSSPTLGDPDLFVFGPTRAACARAARCAARRAGGGAVERLSIRNRGRRTRTFYVAAGFDSDKDVELYNVGYRLW